MACDGDGRVKRSVGLPARRSTYATNCSSCDLGVGTLSQPSRMNSALAGQTTCPATLAPYTPEPPLAGKSPLGGPQPGAKIGSRNMVTLSTSTSTKVCGW